MQNIPLWNGQLSGRKHAVHHSIAAEAIKYFSIAIILVADDEGTRLLRVHKMQRRNFETLVAQHQRKTIPLTIQTMHEVQHKPVRVWSEVERRSKKRGFAQYS